jgi:hypothetical protein
MTVARGSRRQTVAASKRGRKSIPVPFSNTQLVATKRPWVWKIGRAWSSTSSARKPQILCRARALEARLPWLIMAPLARPVVPEV